MSNLKEVAAVFFKLGAVAFGGPAAHIAMMEQEVVEKRKWMDHQHFLDLVGATNLIPGPNSTEMTMHCGYVRAGWRGLIVAGFCFIFPALLITGLMAYLYTEYGSLPEVKPFLYGIKPAVLAIIAGAIFKLGKKALKSTELGIIGSLVLIASLAGLNEVMALMIAGVFSLVYYSIRSKDELKTVGPLLSIPGLAATISSVSSIKVFWIFLKVGSILYGSGYVLFAYLDAELVTKGLMMRQDLIDAIAIGQLTPGPVLSTATFIGYQLNGIGGAIAASVGIFLPSFLFVFILNPLVKKLRNSKRLSYFLDTVNIAAVAIMVSVLFSMSTDTLMDWRSWLLCGFGILFTFGPKKLGSIWLVVLAAFFGYLLKII